MATAKLEEVKASGLRYCNALVDAMLEGIRRRFSAPFDDADCLLSSSFHPKFRLGWLEKYYPEKVARVQAMMEEAVKDAIEETNAASSDPPCDGGPANGPSGTDPSEDLCESDFVSDLVQITRSRVAEKPTSLSKARSTVKAWVESPYLPEDKLTDKAFMYEQHLIHLFARYNTPIPSSAGVERMFSMCKDILRAKRAPLSDAMLMRLTFLRGNRRLLGNN